MELQPISGAASLQEPARAEFAQRRQNFSALEKALESGDLTGAQQAYAKIQQNAPPPSPTGNDSTNRTRAKEHFDALGQALHSGNLGAAKKAFANVRATNKAHAHRQHAASESHPATSDQAASHATAAEDGSKARKVDVSA